VFSARVLVIVHIRTIMVPKKKLTFWPRFGKQRHNTKNPPYLTWHAVITLFLFGKSSSSLAASMDPNAKPMASGLASSEWHESVGGATYAHRPTKDASKSPPTTPSVASSYLFEYSSSSLAASMYLHAKTTTRGVVSPGWHESVGGLVYSHRRARDA
jgi:hypothetical protein